MFKFSLFLSSIALACSTAFIFPANAKDHSGGSAGIERGCKVQNDGLDEPCGEAPPKRLPPPPAPNAPRPK